MSRDRRIPSAGPPVLPRGQATFGMVYRHFCTFAEVALDRVLIAAGKRELFEVIFSGAEGGRKLGLTQEELFGLFQLKCPAGPIIAAA